MFNLHLLIKKHEFITNVKQCFKDKCSLTANNIHSSFKNDAVYINSMLTKENRKLLWLSKQFIKEYNLKFSWANSSGVFIKKDEAVKAMKISSIEQLRQLDTNNNINQLWI